MLQFKSSIKIATTTTKSLKIIPIPKNNTSAVSQITIHRTTNNSLTSRESVVFPSDMRTAQIGNCPYQGQEYWRLKGFSHTALAVK